MDEKFLAFGYGSEIDGCLGSQMSISPTRVIWRGVVMEIRFARSEWAVRAGQLYDRGALDEGECLYLLDASEGDPEIRLAYARLLDAENRTEEAVVQFEICLSCDIAISGLSAYYYGEMQFHRQADLPSPESLFVHAIGNGFPEGHLGLGWLVLNLDPPLDALLHFSIAAENPVSRFRDCALLNMLDCVHRLPEGPLRNAWQSKHDEISRDFDSVRSSTLARNPDPRGILGLSPPAK